MKEELELSITEAQLRAELEKFRPSKGSFSELTPEQNMAIRIAFLNDRPIKKPVFIDWWFTKYKWKLSERTLSSWIAKLRTEQLTKL